MANDGAARIIIPRHALIDVVAGQQILIQVHKFRRRIAILRAACNWGGLAAIVVSLVLAGVAFSIGEVEVALAAPLPAVAGALLVLWARTSQKLDMIIATQSAEGRKRLAGAGFRDVVRGRSVMVVPRGLSDTQAIDAQDEAYWPEAAESPQ